MSLRNRFPLVACVASLALSACAPGTDPDPDAGEDPVDAGHDTDAGQGPACDYTVNGTPGSDPGDCEANAASDVLDENDTTIIGHLGEYGDPAYVAFSVTVDGPLAATTYTMGGALNVYGSLTQGDSTAGWRILKETTTVDGDFTLTITDTGTKTASGAATGWTGLHGTFAATFAAVPEAGSTGTMSFTLEF